MMQSWPEVELGDVLTLKRGYDLPNNARREGRIPIVSSSGISGYHDEAKVSGPGVITGRYGTLGEVFLVNEPYWPLNTTLYVQNFKGNDPTFISYFLRTLNLASQNAAGAVPGLNRNALHMLKVSVPPVPTQHKIAGILSAYDDLIENNTRRGQVLEQMARDLYREWFVEFRFPGHEQAEFVEDEHGRRPEGWERVKLGTLCSIMRSGSTPARQQSEFWDAGDRKWFKTKELNDGFLIDSEEKITELAIKKSSAKVLPAGTILMAIYAAPTVGRLGILTTDASCNQAALGMYADPTRASQTWLFNKLYELRPHLNSIAQGAAQQNISKEKVAQVDITLPEVTCIYHFDTLVQPIYQQIENIVRRNANLRRTRDLFLSKLVSGELDVSALDVRGPGLQHVEEVEQTPEAVA